mgnify:CR=1 FL=1
MRNWKRYVPLLALAAAVLVGPTLIVEAATDGYAALRQAFWPGGGLYTTSLPSLTTGEHNEFHLDSSGRLHVVQTAAAASSPMAGDVAHDAADSGNPVKVGGIGRATVETAASTAADRVNASFTLEGRLRTEDASGYTAHDAADAGNPLKIGGIGRAIWETAASTAADRVNASFDLYGRLRTNPGYAAADAWSTKHTGAANAQATISKAAGTASQRHVCTGYAWSLSSGAGAPTSELITIAIRDGATGAGTIIWEETVSLVATAGQSARGGMAGLWLVGTAATAMTIETDSAPGANVVGSVSISGVTIPN